MSNTPSSCNGDQSTAADPVAVALRYRCSQSTAPTVVAAGHGEVARRIIATAEAHGVPLRRNADLARALSLVELGEQIPLQAFAAVAEIIAYLFRLDGTMAGPGTRDAAATSPLQQELRP